MGPTKRQAEALRLMREGKTKREIAQSMNCSKASVTRLLRQGDVREWLAEHLPEALPEHPDYIG